MYLFLNHCLKWTAVNAASTEVFNLVETSDVEVSALSSHCATTKELPSFEVNFHNQ